MNHMAAKPAFSVLIGHRGCIGEAWAAIIRFILEQEYDLRFFYFAGDDGFDVGHRDELLALVKEQHFDLIMVYSYLSLPEERELFAGIKAHYGKPIIASNIGIAKPVAMKADGADIFLPSLSTVDDLRKALEACGVSAHA